MEYDDGTKRLVGHPEMKEIPASFENDKPVAAAAGRRRRRASAAVGTEVAHKGYNGGSILAAIGAIALAGVVFWLSDSHFRHDGQPNYAYQPQQTQQPQRAYRAIEVTEISEGNLAQNVDRPTAQSVKTTVNANTQGATTSVSRTTADATAGTTATQPDVIYLFVVDGDVVPENETLNQLARNVISSNADVEIVAYTDESGSTAYNQKLSERRAKALGDYLAAHGVARKHISTVGKGETHAFANDKMDRRAEVRVI